MKLNISRLIAIERWHFVMGIVIITNNQSVVRLGCDNCVKLVWPQRYINDGSKLKGIGREWHTPYKGERPYNP